MFEEEYEKLGAADREDFKRLVNYLLGHTYVLSKRYDAGAGDGGAATNPDYNFIVRNLDLFSGYLEYEGLRIQLDTDFGVIRLESDYEGNRHRLNKLTTQILYALRLLYDDAFSRIQTSKHVLTTVGEVNQTLRDAGVVRSRMNLQEMAGGFRTLRKFNIIAKGEGDWTAEDTPLLILPTVLFMVPADRIGALAKELAPQEAPGAPEADAPQEEEEEDEEA